MVGNLVFDSQNSAGFTQSIFSSATLSRDWVFSPYWLPGTLFAQVRCLMHRGHFWVWFEDRFGCCFPLPPIGSSVGKASSCSVGDLGSIPGLGSSPGEGSRNSLQYSSLENPMDRGAWKTTVHGITRVRYDWALSFFLSLPGPQDTWLLRSTKGTRLQLTSRSGGCGKGRGHYPLCLLTLRVWGKMYPFISVASISSPFLLIIKG